MMQAENMVAQDITTMYVDWAHLTSADSELAEVSRDFGSGTGYPPLFHHPFAPRHLRSVGPRARVLPF